MNDRGPRLPRVPTAEANGQRLYYEVHGDGEPLLCVMGLGADSRAWIPEIPHWRGDRRVVVFDNRDVGRSSYVEEPYEVTDMAQDALALADHLELETFDLVGMSLGGAIAQELALAAPERVRTLTLVVTYGGLGPHGEARARLLGKAVVALSPEERVDFLMMLTFSEAFYGQTEQFSKLRQILIDDPYPQPPEAFGRQIAASGRHEARDRLGQISMPVLVIGAERDQMVPVWKSTEIAELIPGAKLTILEGAPHAVNIERAEELSGLVLDFVAAHAPAPSPAS
jgi:3-oxoadipate enol-lactonase